MIHSCQGVLPRSVIILFVGEWKVDGHKLKAARKRAALSLRDLAQLSGVGYVTIHRIEAGKVDDAYPSTLRKLADALRVSPAELVSEREASREPGE